MVDIGLQNAYEEQGWQRSLDRSSRPIDRSYTHRYQSDQPQLLQAYVFVDSFDAKPSASRRPHESSSFGGENDTSILERSGCFHMQSFKGVFIQSL